MRYNKGGMRYQLGGKYLSGVFTSRTQKQKRKKKRLACILLSTYINYIIPTTSENNWIIDAQINQAKPKQVKWSYEMISTTSEHKTIYAVLSITLFFLHIERYIRIRWPGKEYTSPFLRNSPMLQYRNLKPSHASQRTWEHIWARDVKMWLQRSIYGFRHLSRRDIFNHRIFMCGRNGCCHALTRKDLLPSPVGEIKLP